MKQINALHEHDRRWIARVKRLLQHDSFAWGLILLMVALSLLPILLLEKPGVTLQLLLPFIALGVLPILAAAWLRARAGAIMAFLLALAGLAFISLLFHGAAWMIHVDGTTLFSALLGFLIVALATSQLRSVGKRLSLMMAWRQRIAN